MNEREECLKAIRERRADITAPWETCTDGWTVRDATGDKVAVTYDCGPDVDRQCYNQDFIGNAPADIDFLLGEVDRLREEVRSLEDELFEHEVRGARTD